MQLTIARSDLARVVTSVGRVVESRNTIPILGNVMLDADADGLRVVGTDLDIVATASCQAEVQTAGTICVDAKLLADITKKAGEAILSLALTDGKMIVKSGRSKFTLPTLPASDFPDMLQQPFEASFDLDIAALFAPVTFAISTEETRYYLNGVFFRGFDGTYTAVATDGHRLARHVVAGDQDFNGIIVPRKVCGLLPKGVVKVSVSQQQIRLEAGDFSLVSKLIDGTFPDYPRVIPVNNDKIVTVDRDSIMKAADRVSTVSSERGRAVKLSIAGGSIGLHVSNPDSGSANDEVKADYSGEPMEVGFNSQYLRDLLSVMPSGPVTIALMDSGAPGLATSPGFEGLTMVIMPMRV